MKPLGCNLHSNFEKPDWGKVECILGYQTLVLWGVTQGSHCPVQIWLVRLVFNRHRVANQRSWSAFKANNYRIGDISSFLHPWPSKVLKVNLTSEYFAVLSAGTEMLHCCHVKKHQSNQDTCFTWNMNSSILGEMIVSSFHRTHHPELLPTLTSLWNVKSKRNPCIRLPET